MATVCVEIGALISKDPAIRGGKPFIAGTGTSVRAIALDCLAGRSAAEIFDCRPHLTLAQIHAALAYYYANRDEIDSDIAEQDAAHEAGLKAYLASVNR